MVARNYRKQVNDAMTKQAQSLERSSSGLAFSKLSDNVASGSRAMYIQEQRYAATQQLNNVKDLMVEQKSIDSNLSSIHSILQTIQERMLKGMSEDWGESSRQVIAQEIGEKMEQLLQFANAQYAGHTLFGGTNNSVPPFSVSAEGKLQFNGIDVDRIFKSAEDGKYYYYKPQVDANGNEKYTIEGFGEVAFDGTNFLAGESTNQTVEIDGVTYYVNGDTYTNADGKSFVADGNGYSTVVIDGLTYIRSDTQNADGSYDYFREALGDGSEFGRVFRSKDGLTFTEMERVANVNPDELGDGFELQVKADGVTKTFEDPTKLEKTPEALEFKPGKHGGYDQVVIGGRNFAVSGTDEYGRLVYKPTDPLDTSGDVYTSTNGLAFMDANGAIAAEFKAPEMLNPVKTVVPNSGETYADIGLGLKINNSSEADPRTAYQVSFSGLAIMGCAGISYDGETFPGDIIGDKNGTVVSGNLYDLLGQIEEALLKNDQGSLDDCFTQLVTLTDEVGMVRTDLGNRMEYLELTETRLDEDIYNMTTLETDLVSSDPAEEAIKMKECEYVWLALMQLGSKVLPASLLDFIS